MSAMLNSQLSIMFPFNESQYCDFCSQPVEEAFEAPCGHRFCKQCFIEIYAHENIDFSLASAELSSRKEKIIMLSQEGSRVSATSNSPTGKKLEINLQVSGLEHNAKYAHCPLCLREILSFEVKKIYPNYVCENCQQSPAEVSCATCGAALCQDCDAKIHEFKIMQHHRRAPLSSMDDAKRPTCQAKGHSGENAYAEVYSMQCQICLCSCCAQSSQYRSADLVALDQFCLQQKERIEQKCEACRSFIARCRPVLKELEDARQVDNAEACERLEDLCTVHDKILEVLREKFALLQQNVQGLAKSRRDRVDASITSLNALLERLAGPTISVEKIIMNNYDFLLLTEYQSLMRQLDDVMAGCSSAVEALNPPEIAPFPDIEGIDGLNAAISQIRLNELQAIHETFEPHDSTACKSCGQVILRARLENTAAMRRGALMGVKLDSLEKSGLVLDPKKGTPECRYALCRGCGRELGRWSEPGCQAAEYGSGIVFLNKSLLV